jgi:hypothetical protein
MRDSKGPSITVGISGSPLVPSITKETPEHAKYVAFLPTALTSAGGFGPLRTFSLRWYFGRLSHKQLMRSN